MRAGARTGSGSAVGFAGSGAAALLRLGLRSASGERFARSEQSARSGEIFLNFCG